MSDEVSTPIIDGMGVKIGSISAMYGDAEEDYQYSIVLLRSPWVVFPVRGDLETLDERYQLVDIYEKHYNIIKILDSDDYENLLFDWSEKTQKDCYIKFDPEEPDSRGHHICFNVANYISHLWGFPYDTPVVKHVMTWVELSFKRGVFHCYIDKAGEESHAFVAWLHIDEITIYQGYGGWLRPWVTTFDINSWVKGMRSIRMVENRYNQSELILQYFGFPKEIFGTPNEIMNNQRQFIFDKTVTCYQIA